MGYPKQISWHGFWWSEGCYFFFAATQIRLRQWMKGPENISLFFPRPDYWPSALAAVAPAVPQRHIHPNQPHARQRGNYSKRVIRSSGFSGPVGAPGLCKMVQPDTVTQCGLGSGSGRLPIGLRPTGRVTRAIARTGRLKSAPSKAVPSGQRAMCRCDPPLWGHQEWNPFEQLDGFLRSGRPPRQPLS